MAQCGRCCCGGDEASSSTELAEGNTQQINVTYADLESGGASMTNRIINAYAGNSDFLAAGERKLQELRSRDLEDEMKLKEGIKYAIDNGRLEAKENVEPIIEVNVTDRSPDAIAEEIKTELGNAPSEGCILTLQGDSGLGKGTTVMKLSSMLSNVCTWSNGDIFRSITLLATRYAIQEKFSDEEREKFKDIILELQGEGEIKDEFDARIESLLTPEHVLTKDNIKKFFEMLSFDTFDGEFDTKISGFGEEHYVSKVNTTVLKTISKFIPAIAEVTQGEVIEFTKTALGKLKKNGFNVFLEGRKQTLNYIPTPYRFELKIDDPSVLGNRQVALIMGSNAIKKLGPDDDVVAVKKALDDELAKLGKCLRSKATIVYTP